MLKKVWTQTKKHLAGFPGRTREIQARPYLQFQDYLGWRGRKARSDLHSGLSRGLVLASWIRRVATNGADGEATLEDVKVSAMNSYLEGCRYHVCRDEKEELEERRRKDLSPYAT